MPHRHEMLPHIVIAASEVSSLEMGQQSEVSEAEAVADGSAHSAGPLRRLRFTSLVEHSFRHNWREVLLNMYTLPDALLCIDGEVRSAETGRVYDNIGPWTGEIVGVAADASAADVDAAIAAARKAFDTTDWATNHDKRFALVQKLYELFVANEDRLVDIARHEVGAGLGAVNRAQVAGTLANWRDLMEACKELKWEKDFGQKDLGFAINHRRALYEAVGVVGAITPWNFPFTVNVEKVVSALLAGCTVILKPAPDTPLAGTIFGELAVEAGFPAGVLNVITSSDPALAGEMLVTDPRVDLITFTGSTAVGKRIIREGAETMKRVFLELGGKSAAIVMEDTEDFAGVVARSMLVFHAGQGCAVLSRLLVPRSRYEEAKAILLAAYNAYADKWGDFDDPNCNMGPVISAKQLDRIKSYIDIGVAEGATLLAGGNIRTDKGSGYFIEPTCFVDVTNDMRIAREEIFGPVLVVIPFDDEEEAIRIANDSDYGLCGGVWSGDHDRAMSIARRIRTGAMVVNNGIPMGGDLPFGGYKQSGVGRAWGVEGIEEYLETKLVAWAV